MRKSIIAMVVALTALAMFGGTALAAGPSPDGAGGNPWASCTDTGFDSDFNLICTGWDEYDTDRSEALSCETKSGKAGDMLAKVDDPKIHCFAE